MKSQYLIKLFLFVFIIHLFGISYAQNPGIEWQRSLGGASYDVASSIKQTTDGGYIVAGWSSSIDGDVTGNHGTNDFWILKLNSSGTIVWQKSFGGSYDEVANSIQQTTDGGYIIAGWSWSNEGDVSGNHGYDDYWVVKLNSSGDLQWQKSLGGSRFDEAYSIQQTTDEGYIVAGTSWSYDGDVTGHHGSSSTADYWIVKINSSGTIQWQKSLGGSNNDNAYSIRQTTDGGYVVAGYSASNDGDVTGNHGYDDYWVVKLSSSGTIQWQKSLGGSSFDNAISIQQTTDGGYIVAGYSNSINGDVTGNHGDGDYWVVKLNSSGTIEWQKSLGGSLGDNAYSIQQTTDGGYIVAGISNSNDGDVTGNHGELDYWVVKLNSSGTIEWQKSLGGSDIDRVGSIQQTTDGKYIVAGQSMSNDGDVTGHHGTSTYPDYWIVKLTPNVGIKEMEIRNNAILIYPNPANTLINVKLQDGCYDHLYIYNSTGQEIIKLQDLQLNNYIDISNQPSGLYYIKIQSNKGIIAAKFLKQ